MDQLIQNYLDGKLDGQALIDFESQLESNQTLAREVRELKDLGTSLSALGATRFAEEVGEWETAYREEHETPVKNISQPGRGIIFRRSWQMAAVVMVLAISALGILWLSRNSAPDTQAVYASYYSPYEDMILVRGDTAASGQALGAAMDAYNRAEYEQALAHFGVYLEENSEDARPHVYMGIAHLELGNFDEAETAFELAKSDKSFREQAMWYQALAYIKADRLNSARTMLQEIEQQQPVHYRRADAQKILQLLPPANGA